MYCPFQGYPLTPPMDSIVIAKLFTASPLGESKLTTIKA